MNSNELKQYFSMLQKGNKEALEYIYNDMKKPIYTVSLRIVQSKEIAEDITQEVFVKLFSSPPDSSVRDPRAWMFRMARNLSIDALRKKECSDIDGVEIPTDDTTNEIVLKMDVEKAMAKLLPIEREIVTLHLNFDMNFVEIAKITGLSLSASYRKYCKAIKALREMLDGGAL